MQKNYHFWQSANKNKRVFILLKPILTKLKDHIVNTLYIVIKHHDNSNILAKACVKYIDVQSMLIAETAFIDIVQQQFLIWGT